ncbi:ribonuclease H protein [Trifolium medium]|uniref:Ribonuclease H protein n=1 Tax=Trifolium medium TaxID=97028 RepID=A0A392S4D8_9FABA|nr:ribonuclease H protein [Trifolium medium]
MCSAFVAELWGVHEGLLYAWRLDFTAVELNIDSIAVVNAIKNGRSSSSIGNSLVKQIWRLLELDWEIKIVHAYRESNKCVDALLT